MFGCAKLGAYFTLFNYAYSASELMNAVNATSPKVLFTTLITSRYDYAPVLDRLGMSTPGLDIIILEDVSDLGAIRTTAHPFLNYSDISTRGRWCAQDFHMEGSEVSDSDILNLQFTSGSTGLPKAAALTHHGMVNSARYIAREMGVTQRDRINVPVPLFHAFGLIMGKRFRLRDKADAK